MENNQSNEVCPPQRWQILRQRSEQFAEDVVLPKNQRSIQRSSIARDLPLHEADGHYISSSTTEIIPQRQPKYFPVFMIGISFIQVLLMYTVDSDALLLLFGYDPYRRRELWRFITMLLVHSRLLHLWSNVFLQLILGVLLEIIHHWKRIAIIYLGSVLGASLFITVISPKRYAVGASGGCYGLLFAHLSTIILNWKEMDRKCCRLIWLLLYIVFDIGLNLYLELGTEADSVSLVRHHIINDYCYVARLGGAIIGFLIAILVIKNFEKYPWEEKMQKMCVRVLSAICVIVFLVNIVAWGLYAPTEWNFDYTSTYNRQYLNRLLNEVNILFQKSGLVCKDGDEACKLMKDKLMIYIDQRCSQGNDLFENENDFLEK